MFGQLDEAVNCGVLVDEMNDTCESTCCYSTKLHQRSVIITEKGEMEKGEVEENSNLFLPPFSTFLT